MAFIAAQTEPNTPLETDFATTPSVAITKGQLVCFGADDDTITGTVDVNLAFAVALEAVASADAGATRRCRVRLLGHSVMYMKGNGTVTRGALAVAVVTTGKVTNAGATPDARTRVGRFLASSAVDGDLVPVLILARRRRPRRRPAPRFARPQGFSPTPRREPSRPPPAALAGCPGRRLTPFFFASFAPRGSPMSSFNGSTLHVDRPLSNLATAYENHDLIGLQLVPAVPADKASDKFFKRNKANGIRYQDPKISHLQVPPEIETGVTLDNFNCEDYGLIGRVSIRDSENADAPLNLRQDVTLDLASRLRLAQEVRIASLLTTSGNYNSGNVTTLSGSDRWDSSAGGDPLGVVDTLRAAIWPAPNTKIKVFMGIEVWNKLKRHPQLLSLISGGANSSMPAIILRQKMAELLEVDEVLVGEAWQIATNPGQTDVATRVWGKVFGMVRVANSPSARCLHFASSFTWGPMTVQEFIDEKPGRFGAWTLKNSHSTDEKVVADDAGAIVVTPIS